MRNTGGLSILVFLSLFVAAARLAGAQSISFTPSSQSVSSAFSPPIVADLDGNGWLETLGTLNDGKGILFSFSSSSMGLVYPDVQLVPAPNLFVSGRPNDAKAADFDGDGFPDLIAIGYSSTSTDTRALLYFNDGTGRFNEDPIFANLNLRGRGEGIAVADFNNDGYLDIFVPYYTLSCAQGGSDFGDPLCPNAPQAYLFLNDGHGHFREVAQAAGVDFSPLNPPPPPGCPSGSNPPAPNGIQPEGAQAADVNNDGRIDLYVGGRLMINTLIDAQGIPHFKDLCSITMGCGIPAPPCNGSRADEGFKFLDWNNDGLLDLVIQNWTTGSLPNIAGGPTVYQNVGSTTSPVFQARVTTTDGSGHPFFSTGASGNYATLPYQDSFGVNAYDMDGDGLEDIFVAGSPNPAINQCNGSPCPVYPNRVFRNTGSGYEQVSAGSASGMLGGELMAFADINQDGKIDLICSGCANGYFLINNSPTQNKFVSVEMLGPNGERNQQGRIIQVIPQIPQPPTYTRVVDGGSGYHSQSQYPVLVGTPYTSAPHVVKAFYFVLGAGICPSPSTFTMSTGQYAQVFAPTDAQCTNGRVVIYNGPPPPLPSRSMDWLRPALDLLSD